MYVHLEDDCTRLCCIQTVLS